MNKENFNDACNLIVNNNRERAGIGTLGEKTLHAVLKCYFETSSQNHEIKLGNYVADIVGENGIIEIQTRGFEKLRKKLEAFLEISTVTIVYPIASTKRLIWLDNETGEMTKKRKSPKTGVPYDVYFELYKIKSFLTHENLRICIVMLEIEEYRNLDGWSNDKKKGSSRYERIPIDITDEIHINSVNDYIKLIPNDLPTKFSARDFKKASHLSLHTSQTALNILNFIGAVKRVGKQGNAYEYAIAYD